MIPPVLLSASEPDPTRRPEDYRDSRLLLNIREAVRTLCAHILPHCPIVFGGHPAITPLVQQVAERLAHDSGGARQPRVVMFQSALFADRDSSESEVITPAHNADGGLSEPGSGMRNMSLLRMRYEMIGRPGPVTLHPAFDPGTAYGRVRQEMLGTYDFTAAIFIGGMEGVECEFHIFRDFHPDTPAYPIASTGAASKDLLDKVKNHLPENTFNALKDEPSYNLLLQEIFPSDLERWRRQPRDNPNDPRLHIDPAHLDRFLSRRS